MLKVFHGSTLIIREPLVSVGRDHLDFGKGFYVTTLQEQAASWASRMGERLGLPPVVNAYDLDIDEVKKDYRCLSFHAYDITWLDFIAANRNGQDVWKKYDLIEGGIANDRIADTVEAYLAGMMSAEIALERLSQHKPNHQICILRQDIVEHCMTFLYSKNIL